MAQEKAKPSADARAIVVKANNGDQIIARGKEVEDDYVSYYQLQGEYGLIRPPYDLRRLEELAQTNNALTPCIDCMVTNIAGTGWEIERADGEQMDDSDKKVIKPAEDFFKECSPMMSFQTLSMKMRRELETNGNGYIEIVRNLAGEIVFAGHLESKMMRIARLQEPVWIDVKMSRGGKDVTFKQFKRERRYCQKVGAQYIWFKEFGASRDLDRMTGRWAEPGQVLPADKRATEVLEFSLYPDLSTPYGLPRWLCQTPSVLGSRKAEEHNLEFFDNGGIPPYLVIVQGGQLAEKTVEAVRNALNEKGAHARVQVIEAFSTSGDLNGNNTVQVKVERFGAERTNDAMFQKYDEDCEAKVRRAFRLPPLLLGASNDHTYATANAAYLVAEAQVFKPERDAFDEKITSSILPELLGGSRDYVFRSKPVSIIDAATQLAVIAAANATGLSDKSQQLKLLGEIGGMEFAEVDLSNVKPAPNFGVDPTGNVVPIPLEPQAADAGTPTRLAVKSESDRLTELLSCSLAVLNEHGYNAVAAE